ncbi:MAG TPA: glycosyltransferase [Ferruginibacter sp.]|nr:glycosyltransferase [Ferruginibacter sp.]
MNRRLAKNILFISYDGMTDPLGQSQVIPYLEGLSKHGYNIFLISCEKKEVYTQRKEAVQKILDQADITWVPLNYTKKPPVLSTLIDITKLKRAAKKIHLNHTIHMVHTRPGVPALVGLWMKKKFGIKFLNDIREFYADSRVDGGIWNTSNVLYKRIYHFFKQQEEEQVSNSDGIVCLTYAAEKIIKQWPSYKTATPLAVIPCSADLQLFDPQNLDEILKENFRVQLGINKDDFIISYLGSIGGWYLTAEMMMFCKRVLINIPHARFLFISPHLHQQIIDTAAKYDVPRDKIISIKAVRNEVPVLLSFSSYSLFFIKPCYSKLSSSPTKHGELMALGIPVITNSGVGDVKDIVKKYQGGYVVDDFSTGSFDKVIEQMENAIFDKKVIREGAFEYYSLQKAIGSYTALYDEILKD